jgi:putative transcriptional regulator
MNQLKLRHLRGDKSLREVAEVLGITPQMLGKVKLKRRVPSPALAKKIANYYKVTVEEIFLNDSRDKTCHSKKSRGQPSKIRQTG